MQTVVKSVFRYYDERMSQSRSPRRASALKSVPTSKDMADEQTVAQRLTFLLARLVSRLEQVASPQFRAYGLSIPAARTMSSLLEHGGSQSVGSLAEITCIDISTMSHILRRLEALRYVDRERQADDNRVVVAVLTRKGTEVARFCREASLAHEAALIQGMSAAEVAKLKRTLEAAYDNARKNLA